MRPSLDLRLGSTSLKAGGGGAPPAPVMRSIANRVSMPQTQSGSFVNERAISVHELNGDLNGFIEVSWVNYRVNGGVEVASGAAIADGAGQVTYTSRTSGLPVTVPLLDATTGLATLTAASGGLMTGRAAIDALAGTKIIFEEKNSISTGVIFTQFKSDLANGDRYQFSAGAVGAIGSPGVQTFDNTFKGPSLIAALQSAVPVAALWGDSITDGIYDMPNTSKGDIGVTPRLLSLLGVRFVNLSSRGDAANLIVGSSPKRKILQAMAGANFAVDATGINDLLGGGRTGAQVIASRQANETYYGLPTVQTTILPFTTGGPDTPWNAGQEAQRQIVNAWVRSQPMYFDPDIVLATGSGGWRNDDAVYADWLHPANIGGAYAAQHAPIVGTSLAVHGMAPRAAGPVMPGKGTNLIVAPYSIDNATWSKFDMTVALAQKDAEYGGTAQAALENTANVQHRILHAGISMDTGTYELEMDLAYLGYQWLRLELSGVNAFAAMDVLNGAAGTIFNSTPATWAITAIGVTPLGRGFFRFKFTIVVVSAATLVYPSIATATGNLSGTSHVGDIAKGFLVRPKFWLRKLP